MDSKETTSTSTPQPTEPAPPASVPPPSSSIPSTPEISSAPSPSSNPNPSPVQNSQPSTPLQQHPPPPQQQPQQQPVLQQQQQQQQQQQLSTLQHSQPRPSSLSRPRPQPPYPHFSQHLPSLPPSSSSSSSSSSSLSSSVSSPISAPPMQRGGLAIGVPAHHARPPQQPSSYSSFGTSSFNQQFGGLSRNSVNVPDPNNSSSTQVRQPIQGIQSIGMIGSHGSGSQLRPGGVSANPQPRPVQPPLKSQSPSSSQSLASQKFQSHSLLRVPSMGSPGSQSPGTPQNLQTHTQPWMSGGSQGKQMHPPSLPSTSYRPQMKPQSLQQRSHIPQQHHPLPTAFHQQQIPSPQQQQQPSQPHQSQDHYGQQYPAPRVAQSALHQQQVTRGQGSGSQKSPSLAIMPTTVQSGSHNTTSNADAGEICSKILSKRTIHELVTQIDPSERLDPEVEEILVEIADDFVDTITTCACSLAKHRKSTTLEAKDIILHLEKNWNMTLPGFGGDEIKIYKKQYTNDIHRERLAVIKKSVVGSEVANMKTPAGQAAGNVKGHTAKAPAIGSPKRSEVL